MSDVLHQFVVFGEVVRSEIPIEGAIRDLSSMRPTIRVERGNVTGDRVRDTSGSYELRTDGSLVFTAGGVGRYLCCPDGRLVIDADDGADPAHVAALLEATALPAMIWLLDPDSLLLHAAAVVPEGDTTAVAILAPTRGGKSTVLAQLLDEGCSVVADDVVRVRLVGQTIVVAGLPSVIRQRSGGADALGDLRRSFEVPARRQVASASLGALVLLERAVAASSPPCTHVSPGEALRAILAHRHRRRVPELLCREPAGLQLAGVLSRSVPVLRWTRTEGDIQLRPEELAWLPGPITVGNS